MSSSSNGPRRPRTPRTGPYRIQVARRVQTKESTAGLRGGTTVVEQGIEIDLANRLGRPVTVARYDAVDTGAHQAFAAEIHAGGVPDLVIAALRDFLD